ncbi:class I SAM-dependent methyltransferase [Saccharothrix sp. NPDC042600]|uniref:CmnU n=1 Tax=Saccharothrix mutabilis subsp. capreolus TaxID=66854 RepID=A6YEH1_STRMP|nr:CmnU [Saccharothrix mutabilis subsp. capreolus]
MPSEGLVKVVGKRCVPLADAEFAELRARHRSVLLDVGTGDGKHAYRLARADPDRLVVGVDANPDRMRGVSARAAAKPARGGLPNLVLVHAAAEEMPPCLGDVDEMHVLMPWGSLLRGVLGRDPAVLAGLAGACRAGARFHITVNLHAWRPAAPAVTGIAEPTPEWVRRELAHVYAEAGLRVTRAGYLADVGASELTSTWTRRLGACREEFDVLGVEGAARGGSTPGVAGITSKAACLPA